MRSYMVALGLLFIAIGHPSFAQKTGAAEESVVRVAEGAPLTVECPLRVEQRAEWRRDGAAPPPDLRAGGEAPAARGARLAARLHAAAARPHHAGLYTCSREPAAHRVRVFVLPAVAGGAVPDVGTTAAAPAAAGADVDADGDGDGDSLLPFTFDVNRHFSLNCTSSAGIDTSAINYAWQANGTAVEKVPELTDRYKLEERGAVFTLTARARENDFGNYTCLVNGAVARAWRVGARPIARLPDNSNVVEGQKLKLTCKLIGKPYPPVEWSYAPEEGVNATPVAEVPALAGRVRLDTSAAGVPRGDLVLEAAQRGDAGVYSCAPAGVPPPAGAPAAATVLRVKDMYAALWPFLGICAEVFVLCAIILVYEKRRTKPELDDSDTDNHDQKKT